jgi:hypothetical protein
MTAELTTTIRNIENTLSNEENVETILQFFELMKKIGTSERYQNNNLKAITAYSKISLAFYFFGASKRQNLAYIFGYKNKVVKEDPDKRWITTWNAYLGRIEYFYNKLPVTVVKKII